MSEFLNQLLAVTVSIGGIELKPFDLVLKILLPVLGIYISYRLIRFLLKRFFQRTLKLKKKTSATIERIVKIILRIVMLAAIVIIITAYFGAEIPGYVAALWEGLSKPILTSGAMQISIVSIILIIPILYSVWWITKRIMGAIDEKVLSRVVAEKSVRFSIFTLTRYILLIILLLFGLSLIGIDLSVIAVILGVLGIGIGFGLQNTVANFFAGLVIVFERPIKVGDRILVDGLEGDVIKIRLRSTVIRTPANETIVIPNSQLVEHYIHNNTFETPEIVIVNKVQVAYGSDLKKVEKILVGIGERNPFLLPQKEAKAWILSFDDSGITMGLAVWITKAQNKMEALAWTNMEIWESFRKQKITIPFPQLDVHMKKK